VSEQRERKFFTSLPKSYEGDPYSSQSQSYSYLAGNTQAPQRFYLLSHWWVQLARIEKRGPCTNAGFWVYYATTREQGILSKIE
jgi:hypothetical protein